MYKETIICIIIIVVIITLDFFTQNYTTKTASDITENLMELKEDIENNDTDSTQKKLKQLDEKWDEKHDKLAYYIEHDEIEKIDTAFSKVKSFVENDDIPSAVAELETSKFVLEHIEKKYKFNLQNIF